MPSNESLVGSNKRTFWFRDAIIYQVWPASFRDSNDDGMGDIQGIIASLDYIKSLGANTIWLSPMYDSPQIDMGYDISDYESVYPPYGTVADMDELIKQCHNRGLKLLLDLVINHTSDQHAWFKESRKSKDNPKRDWYIWRPAKYDAQGNRKPPNNWRSNFNQPAWTWDEATQEYYLHLFCPEQPDVNWTNEETRKAIYKSAMEFWLEKGVNGFRVDTVNMYSKPMDFPDAPVVDPGAETQPAGMLYCNGPEMHKYLKEMGAILERYDAMTVGELPNTPKTADVVRYVSAAENELSEVFQFDIVDLGRNHVDFMVLDGFKLADMKRVVEKWQRFTEGNDAWGTVFIENHDVSRSINRYASAKPEHVTDSGKLLALMNMTLTGTVYVYQGEEIGMTNVPSTWPAEEYLDVNSINYFAAVKKRTNNDPAALAQAVKNVNQLGRDNARTPVQWSSAPNGGFSKTPTTKPWMRTNDNYKTINIEHQESDENSVLNFYRKAISTRKQYSLLGKGQFKLLEEQDEALFKYFKQNESETAFIVLNFTDQQQQYSLPSELGSNPELVLDTRSDASTSGSLQPYQGRLYIAAK